MEEDFYSLTKKKGKAAQSPKVAFQTPTKASSATASSAAKKTIPAPKSALKKRAPPESPPASIPVSKKAKVDEDVELNKAGEEFILNAIKMVCSSAKYRK